MRRPCPARLVLVALLALAAAPAAAAAPRVLLVGVDGASWSVIDPLLAERRMPHLEALLARGVQAELATVEPVISPTVWTSIASGRSPAAHGVTSFFGDARSVRVPTLFERLAAQGLRVGVYDWLLTWPPRAYPGGFLVPGWLRRDARTAPPDAFARAGGPGYRYANRGLVSREGYFRGSFDELARKPAQWRHFAQAFDVQAGAVVFYAVDALSHRFWADSFPDEFDDGDAPAPEPAYREAVQHAYEGVDRALGELLAGLPPETAVLIASDHGFRAASSFRRRWSFRTVPRLVAAGLVPGRDAFEVSGEFAFVTLRVLPGPFAEREALLDRLESFYEGFTDAEGRPLFWVQPVDLAARPPGAERPLVEKAKALALRALTWALGIQVPRPDAHALLVAIPLPRWEEVWPEGEVRIGDTTVAARDVVYGDGFTGEHDPTAVFVAAGGPLRHVPGRGQLSVLDVAPLYTWLAGGDLPDDFEGRLREDWIAPEALAARPPRTVAAAGLPRLPEPEAPPATAAEVMEQLRSMGYVR